MLIVLKEYRIPCNKSNSDHIYIYIKELKKKLQNHFTSGMPT